MSPSPDEVTLPELVSRVDQLAAAVVTLTQKLAASDIRPWLTEDDPDEAHDNLTALGDWLAEVWVHYPGPALPVCWWRHGWVIEELGAARHAWLGALRRGVPGGQFAEWHRTVRPGTQKRIHDELKTCEHDRHPLGADDPLRRPYALDLPTSPGGVVTPWLRDRSEPSSDHA